MAGEHPGWDEVDAADEPAWSEGWRIGFQLDFVAAGLQDDSGTADRELADAALTQATADDDALGVFPVLEPQEAPDHLRKFLRELLDRAVNHPRGLFVGLRRGACRAASW